jgi:hypothetical protein
MGEVWRFVREKLPDWLAWELEHSGLMEFDLDSLTPRQDEKLTLLLYLRDLVEAGLVEVDFDGRSPPKFRITKQGAYFVRKFLGGGFD